MFVDFIEASNFSFSRFCCIWHIMVKKLNFRFSKEFFEIEKKNIHFIRKCVRQNLLTFFKRTILHFYVFFVFYILRLKNWIFDFQQYFFKLKWKIYILSESVSDKIYRPYWRQLFFILTFFRISHIIVEKLNFRYSTVFFKIKTKNIHFIINSVRQFL